MNVPLIKISSLTKLKFTMFRSASLLLNAYSHSALLKETIVPRTRTFQDSVFNYLYDSKYCTEVLFRLSREIDFDKMEKILTKYTKHSESPSKIADQLDEESLHQLPAFVFHMKTSDPRKNRRIAATDALCADLLNITVQNQGKIVSLDLLHSWLICLHPDIHRISELQCYGKLIKRRCRELLTGPLDEQSFCPIPLVYLTFVAGLGKRNTGDSHEVLNQLAMFTESNPEITYEKCNSLELAAMCESFFKGGMKLDSKRFLSHISSTLCLLLSPKKVASSCRSEFNPYVVVSLLKVIRQVNYVEGKVLQLLSDFVMNPENEEEVRNIGFLTNVVSAFVGPGRKSQLSSARLKDESIVSSSAKKTSKTSLLNRVEHLVVDIIGENERLRSDKILSLLSSPKNIAQEKPVESEATLKRVRLKDVSRWLWAASSLGYEISPETYQRDLKDRFYSGELTRRTADAVDALLALAIMGHYLDDFIVMKILRSPEFRSALRGKFNKSICS
jgi:transcriptional antiterminator Rof (Rho-off)